MLLLFGAVHPFFGHAATWQGTSTSHDLTLSENWDPRPPGLNQDVYFPGEAYPNIYFNFAEGAQHRLGDFYFLPADEPEEEAAVYLFSGDGTEVLRLRNIYNFGERVVQFDLDVMFMNHATVSGDGVMTFNGDMDTHSGNNSLEFGGTGRIVFGEGSHIASDTVLTLSDEVFLQINSATPFDRLIISGNVTLDMAHMGTLSLNSLFLESGATLNIVNWDEDTRVQIAEEPVFSDSSSTFINGFAVQWDVEQTTSLTPIPEPSAYAASMGILLLLYAIMRLRWKKKNESQRPKRGQSYA